MNIGDHNRVYRKIVQQYKYRFRAVNLKYDGGS